MFKKRFGEMDLYKEFRRSHERVKVMLSESDTYVPEDTSEPVSAQDNLQKFIKQHEDKLNKQEEEKEEKNYVNLAEETILPDTSALQEQTESDYSQSSDEHDYTQQEFQFETENEPLSEPVFSSSREQEFPQQPEYQSNFNEMNEPVFNYDTNLSSITPPYQPKTDDNALLKHKNVEDELEDIIRDSLSSFSTDTVNKDSDIDPELLKMLKNLLFKNRFNNRETNYEISRYKNENENQTNIESINQSEDSSYQTPEPISFDQQLKNQQAPPKLPQSKSTVKRPEMKGNIGVFDPSFTTADFENDSSLALTKKEISLQVKNLIRESLEEDSTETTKTNDLLELEKQLKEHIEKIKQSKKET